MNKVAPASGKIAISLPGETLAKIERLRRRRGLTRSAVILQAVEGFFGEQEKAERVRCYEEGYRRMPETRGEVRAAGEAAAELLAGEPWE